MLQGVAGVVVLALTWAVFAATVYAPLRLDAGEVSANLADWLQAWGEVMGR